MRYAACTLCALINANAEYEVSFYVTFFLYIYFITVFFFSLYGGIVVNSKLSLTSVKMQVLSHFLINVFGFKDEWCRK